MAKEVLLGQNEIQLICGGKSLEPLLHDGDTCFFKPTAMAPKIRAGDIVFCQVQPNSRYYVHLVWRVVEYKDKYTDNVKTC